VGVHTIHKDEALRAAAEATIRDFPGVEFVHFDPMELFGSTQGKVITPSHTTAITSQLAQLDIAFARQSGCATTPWICARFKTGQRLVNLMAVGVPVVVWGDNAGFLEVARGYPTVRSVDEGMLMLRMLLENATLRKTLSELGVHLSEAYSLPSIVQRYHALLNRLLSQGGNS